jgi:histidinol-phosphate phosphatase family protein
MFERAAVFLDLQGTLGGEGLDDIRHFAFYKFAIPAIKLINKADLTAIIITNQSHIARGDFSYQYFQERMAALQDEVEKAGAKIDAVYCCPHRVEDDCECRKPKPGLVLAACKDLSLNVAKCYLVGDTGAWDMILAHSIGSKKILVRTGLGESSLTEYRHTWVNITPDFIAEDVLEAAKWIIADRVNSLAVKKK